MLTTNPSTNAYLLNLRQNFDSDESFNRFHQILSFLSYIRNGSSLDNIQRIQNFFNDSVLTFHDFLKNLCELKKMKKEYEDFSIERSFIMYETFFEVCIKSGFLSESDGVYLLKNFVSTLSDLSYLARANLYFLDYILKNFLIDAETMKSYDENIIIASSWCRSEQVYNVFDYFARRIDNCQLSEELKTDFKKLLKINKLLCSFKHFNADLKKSILACIEKTPEAQNRLIQIVDNNLESNFDFESLMTYLKKKEKKNILNI